MAAAKLLMRAGNKASWSPYVLTRSVLKGWWSADDHGTSRMTDDGAGLISSWIDRIGGIAATGTTTARPTWATASFNSSYAGVTFDGTANCLVSTAYTALPTGATAGEIWIVASNVALVADTGSRYAISYGTTGATARRLGRAVVSANNRFQVADNVTVLNDLSTTINSMFIGGGAWSGTTESGRINGAPTSPATATISTLNTSTVRLRIGALNIPSASNFWSGVIRQVIVTTTLTASQQQQMEGYLACNSGLQSLLPSTHPYRNVCP